MMCETNERPGTLDQDHARPFIPITEGMRPMVAQTHDEVPEWLRIKEAAAYAGVAEGTLRRYHLKGELQAYRRGPRILWFRREDLDALLRPADSRSR